MFSLIDLSPGSVGSLGTSSRCAVSEGGGNIEPGDPQAPLPKGLSSNGAARICSR